MTLQQLLEQLKTEGLRIAAINEAGWTYTYIDDQGDRLTIWVTD